MQGGGTHKKWGRICPINQMDWRNASGRCAQGHKYIPQYDAAEHRGRLFLDQALAGGDEILVVLHRAEDHVFGYVGTVDADEFHTLAVLAGDVFVGGEIVDEAADDVFGQLLDVGEVAVNGVVLQDGYDLVVRLAVIQKPQAADRSGSDDDVAVCDILFGEHADVKRVAVAFDIVSGQGLVGEFGHTGRAICPRKKAVQ